MLPSMNPKSQKPVKSRPHLILKVRDGWRFDESAVAFVSDNEQIALQKTLPKKSSVEPRVPTAKPTAKNKSERELSRYFNVLLSTKDDLKKLAGELEKLKCTEKVDFPVEVSLPAMARQKSPQKTATKGDVK